MSCSGKELEQLRRLLTRALSSAPDCGCNSAKLPHARTGAGARQCLDKQLLTLVKRSLPDLIGSNSKYMQLRNSVVRYVTSSDEDRVVEFDAMCASAGVREAIEDSE
jgi:hypothetical protein